MAKPHNLAAALLLLTASSTPAAPSLSAQVPTRVSSDVLCAECVITIDTVLTLGGLEGEGMEAIHETLTIVIDARERILIANSVHPRIYVFDMAGRFLRTVGREGEGPGEYHWISHINAGPRYIHVFEFDRGRTLLDHDFEFVRRDLFPGQINQVFVTDSEVAAFSSWIPTSDADGYSLHLLAPSGELESFGDGASGYRTRASGGALVTGDGGSLWSIEWLSTRMTRWDLLPKPAPVRIWERTVDEWERHDQGPSSDPIPGNTGAMIDESGLWIVWREPDTGWAGRPSDESRRNAGRVQDIYDNWVELLDPATGRTLARYFDNGGFLITFVPGSRYLVAYHETEAGVPYIHLLEPRLSRGPR